MFENVREKNIKASLSNEIRKYEQNLQAIGAICYKMYWWILDRISASYFY